MKGGLFVTQQPTIERSKVVAVEMPKESVDFEYDQEQMKMVMRLIDEAKQIKIHPTQYQVNIVKSHLKQMSFVVSSQLDMVQKNFKIDLEYLQKRWRRQYRLGFAFMSELTAKQEREYNNVSEAIRKIQNRVQKLSQFLG